MLPYVRVWIHEYLYLYPTCGGNISDNGKTCTYKVMYNINPRYLSYTYMA